MQADLLVSSQGACAEAIIKAGGPKVASPKIGDVTVSGGFASVRHVIHIQCCNWNGGQGEKVGIQFVGLDKLLDKLHFVCVKGCMQLSNQCVLFLYRRYRALFESVCRNVLS